MVDTQAFQNKLYLFHGLRYLNQNNFHAYTFHFFYNVQVKRFTMNIIRI